MWWLVVVSCLPCILSQYASAGTTPGFASVFMGRCLDRTTNHPYFQTLAKQGISFNCTQIYNNFASAYAGVDPLSLTNTSFQAYLQSTRHPVPANQSLFWTGSSYVTVNPGASIPLTRDVVHDYSLNGNRFWTLEDTLWGNILNGLSFCGAQDQSVDIYNYTACPSYGAAGSSIFFWNSASAQFAQVANGNLYMLGYAGTNYTTYCNSAPEADRADTTTQTVTLSCDPNATISSIQFTSVISLESSGGICAAHSAADSCTNLDIAAAANTCIGKSSCVVTATPDSFDTPCSLDGNLTNQLSIRYQCLGPRLIYRTGANPSIFATVEIVNLNASNILTFTTLIIDNPLFPSEACGSGTVAQMSYDLVNRPDGPQLNPNQTNCIDNPAAVMHVMCIDNSGADTCALGADDGDSTDKVGVGAVGFAIGFVVTSALFCGYLYYRNVNKKQDQLLS